MEVTVKGLPLDLVFGEYNGQVCTVLEEFHTQKTKVRFIWKVVLDEHMSHLLRLNTP